MVCNAEGKMSYVLLYTHLNITTNAYCANEYKPVNKDDQVTDNMICTTDYKSITPRDACQVSIIQQIKTIIYK